VIGSHAYVGVSIGVARAPTDGTDRSELLRKADIALYEAKREGRSCTKVFAPKMDANVQRRQEIESEMRKALEAGDQFKTVYQPVYAGDGKTITGVEALIRWEHPKHGMLSPAAFIPVAEECGLIGALGELVLREACLAGAAWPIRTIAVNISPLQLQSPDFADRVLAIVRETGMDPRRLELEITETSLVDYNEQISGTIKRLRAAGIRFALDDFGTGYSSLGSLRAANVDKIKIDRSFVRGLDQSDSSQAFVQAILNLSRAIGVTVTAEGVETADQHRFLEATGCDELQGFLFSVPLARDGIDRLLGEGAARKGKAAA
jgi:predicted signal transduction protein with EAL and GGDEF domain